MNSLHDRPALERDLLVELGGLEEPNGRQLREQLEDSLGRELQTAHVYERLTELAEESVVEKEPVDGRENIYRLTPEGRSMVQEYARWVWSRVPE